MSCGMLYSGGWFTRRKTRIIAGRRGGVGRFGVAQGAESFTELGRGGGSYEQCRRVRQANDKKRLPLEDCIVVVGTIVEDADSFLRLVLFTISGNIA